MSTFKYYNANVLLGTKQLNWETATLGCLLVTSDYAALPTDLYVSHIPSSSIIVRSGALTGANIVKGVYSAVVPTFAALLSPLIAVAVILYQNTGTDSTSPLIYYSSDGIGFPFKPIGANYAVAFDQANGGWFS